MKIKLFFCYLMGLTFVAMLYSGSLSEKDANIAQMEDILKELGGEEQARLGMTESQLKSMYNELVRQQDVLSQLMQQTEDQLTTLKDKEDELLLKEQSLDRLLLSMQAQTSPQPNVMQKRLEEQERRLDAEKKELKEMKKKADKTNTELESLRNKLQEEVEFFEERWQNLPQKESTLHEREQKLLAQEVGFNARKEHLEKEKNDLQRLKQKIEADNKKLDMFQKKVLAQQSELDKKIGDIYKSNLAVPEQPLLFSTMISNVKNNISYFTNKIANYFLGRREVEKSDQQDSHKYATSILNLFNIFIKKMLTIANTKLLKKEYSFDFFLDEKNFKTLPELSLSKYFPEKNLSYELSLTTGNKPGLYTIKVRFL